MMLIANDSYEQEFLPLDCESNYIKNNQPATYKNKENKLLTKSRRKIIILRWKRMMMQEIVKDGFKDKSYLMQSKVLNCLAKINEKI